MDIKVKPEKSYPRRTILLFGSLLLIYPVFRFTTHRTPKKPVKIEIREPLKKGGFLVKDKFIVFSNDKKIWAVSRKCTHLGCRLLFKEEKNILECPCHQSRFSRDGMVINGPAKINLPVYKVERSGDSASFTVTI